MSKGGVGIDDPFGSAQDKLSIDYFRFVVAILWKQWLQVELGVDCVV